MTKVERRRSNKYKGWQIFRDRNGDWRCYHRKTRATIDCRKFETYSLAFDMEIHRINETMIEKQSKPGTLGMLITKYRAGTRFQKELAPRTQSDYQKCFDYLQAIEDTPLDRFTPPLVAKIRDKALEKRQFRFANYVRSVLSVIFDWGLEYGYTTDNPAAKVKPARRPKTLPDANRPWTDAERETVLAALPAHMELAIALMMFYALDPQDALALPRSAISDKGLDTRRNKTGRPIYLPLFEPVASAMARAPKHDAVTICANSWGRPWTYSGFSSSWITLKGKMEAEGVIQPGLTLKGLRHTVATILAEMGKDHGTIALVLGHATEAMAKHYSRRADMTRRATSAVSDFEAELNKRKTNSVKHTV
ncbi:tyrosine-type recombinase/integrase [Endobacterium cereale]|uniref:tyrosine-type recombinase/integrase n=1 Tax=Endobacterium cereale TaxID=2663029 RepID=UPI002B45DBBA|nr:tyrosine-type recombinase/integrase [Endobacterium cereale]MEB2848323.1 tyrosine-type recombinase/integrase [Endobacterium cereale]